MDKYTVDLDQVLNDFEYNELTDQITNVQNQSAGSSSNSRQLNLYNFFPTVTKHSITNVFHSLNEYLNTTIPIADNRTDLTSHLLSYDNKLTVANQNDEESIGFKEISCENTLISPQNEELSDKNEISEVGHFESDVNRVGHIENEIRTVGHIENNISTVVHLENESSVIGHFENESVVVRHLENESGIVSHIENQANIADEIRNESDVNQQIADELNVDDYSEKEIGTVDCLENQISNESHLEIQSGKDSQFETQNSRDSHLEITTSKNSQLDNQISKDSHFETEVSKDSHLEIDTGKPIQLDNKISRDSHFENQISRDSQFENQIIKDSQLDNQTSIDSHLEIQCSEASQRDNQSSKNSHFETPICKDSHLEIQASNDSHFEIPLNKDSHLEIQASNGDHFETNDDIHLKTESNKDSNFQSDAKEAGHFDCTQGTSESYFSNLEISKTPNNQPIDDSNEPNLIPITPQITNQIVSISVNETIPNTAKNDNNLLNTNESVTSLQVIDETAINKIGRTDITKFDTSSNSINEMTVGSSVDKTTTNLNHNKVGTIDEMSNFDRKIETSMAESEFRDHDVSHEVCDNKVSINDDNKTDLILMEKPKKVTEIPQIEIMIGFDDNIDLDDSEINQIFNDLEKEYNGATGDEIKQVGNTENSLIGENLVDGGSTDVDDEVSNKGCDATENQNGDETENRPINEDIIPEKGNSNLRPCDLPLEKRQINLIGEPGSTPYNNVYVNKELVSNGGSDMSEECSTSASPTFSDVSTESTVTTTSSSSRPPSTDLQQLDKERQIGGKEDTTEEEEEEDNARALVSSPVEGVTKSQEINKGVGEEEGGSGKNSNQSKEEKEEQGNDSNRTNESQDESIRNDDENNVWLGKQAPLWIPDGDTDTCLHCDMKFTVLKRRHHCRACGLVLCSKCCNQRFRLEYLDSEARVCMKCYEILNKDYTSSSDVTPELGNSPNHRNQSSQPNPNNPLEYCSTIPPLQQINNNELNNQQPPSVMVPVGVLKRKGSTSNKNRINKSVMFCDGIRPGSDLTNLDNDFNYNNNSNVGTTDNKLLLTKKTTNQKSTNLISNKRFSQPILITETNSFIPNDDNSLPPIVTIYKNESSYSDCPNNSNLVSQLRNETVTFALQLNLSVHVKIVNLDCCVNKIVWCFTTDGLRNVGQNEIIYLIELLEDENMIPKDLFYHINNIYLESVKGIAIKELGLSLYHKSIFLDSKNHAGFIYVHPSFQCLQNINQPEEPFLFGILIHRWETPWAKLFPLRLVLRLGAEYRYYPCPIISTRHRDSVFVEIGHTIINLLADFRNFSYTLPQIRGLTIHMEDKNTTVTIPSNRYDQVMKSINNSSDHILALAGTFSSKADSYLVCIQDTQGNENSYTTHAINIHNKPRKVTGASFIVFNGALKSSSGLTAKSSIVEDGLMIQIPSEQMLQIRDSLRNMKNFVINCGCINAQSDETVNIIWGKPDGNFNLNVYSPIDNQSMSGIPSIRVHNGKDWYSNNGNRLLRWTEVYIIQNGEEPSSSSSRNQDPIDISKLCESIARATCTALVKYLDLLISNNFLKIGIRTTLHIENVSYSAGSNQMKLPPIYMKSLDNELIPVLHRIISNNFNGNTIILELIFRILNN